MATANIIVGAPGSIPIPPVGEATLFIDSSNNNTLSLKLSDGTVKVYTADNAAECCSCEIAKKWAEDIACALKDGMLKASEYQTLINTGLTVTATENDGQCTVSIGPQAPQIAPVSLAIIPNVTAKTNPSTQQYYVQFTPLNTTNQNVVWVSSNTAAGIINQSGLFTTVAAGTTTIQAVSLADGTVVATKTITVS